MVGAGMAGLTAARELRERGVEVEVFDKGRGPGGRLASRRVTLGTHNAEAASLLSFDHGAQYFTARDPRFRQRVAQWREEGVVAPWEGRIRTLRRGQLGDPRGATERFVGVPRMSALTRQWAAGMEVRCGHRVEALERHEEVAGWTLRCVDGQRFGPYDAVGLTAPAVQSGALLETAEEGEIRPFITDLRGQVESVELEPCWAVMVAFEEPLAVEADGAFVEDSPLSWIARDSSKPGRPAAAAGVDAWVLHASALWSREHLEEEREAVLARLLEALDDALGGPGLPPAIYQTAHRWRYALPPQPLADACLSSPRAGLAVAGDWCGGPRVEGAFLSGLALAEALV